MRSPHVVCGYHHWGMVTGLFAYSLARAVAYEGGRIKACIQRQSPYTEEARNLLIETFLAMPPCDYFLMVDCDIEFEKDAVSRTMWVAQHMNADVVWGNYALGSFSNSLFSKDANSDMAIPMDDLKPNGIYPNVYAGGTGWCLIKRELLERMRREMPGPWFWFNRDIIKDADGKEVRMGEDLSFGRRVHQLGGKQIGYTGLFLVHHKLHPTAPQFMQEIAAELGKPMFELPTQEITGNGASTGSWTLESKEALGEQPAVDPVVHVGPESASAA